MILQSTTQKLQIVLGGAAATANSPVLVDYVDFSSSAVVPGVAVSNTNGASAVDILAAPASSTQRRVSAITICNADSAAISVTIRINDTGTTYDILKGVTLQPLSALQFTRDGGWEVVAEGGGVKDLRAGWVQEFNASGTWYKPPNIRFVMVECVGGGGGGGGGTGGASGTARPAGGGGGGGSRTRRLFLASELPASVTITVATQASGGVGQANSVGTDGGQGGNSSFGTYLKAYGGGGGKGTTYTYGGFGAGGTGAANGYTTTAEAMASGQNGGATDDWRGSISSSFLGASTGSGSSSSGTNSNNGSGSYFSATGGTGGGGVSAANATTYAGQPVMPGQFSTVIGAITFADGLAGVKAPGYCGSGGMGGSSVYLANGNPVGFRGGDGAYPGGGGGGGGAASTGSGTATGGAGGKGAGGMVRVMGW